ncbi:MAG: CHAT domain-containing protein [Pyrinomonadaceae bacterium]|nr:CHAT domain-containing protein [Pyrinomonadaceae bacterium]
MPHATSRLSFFFFIALFLSPLCFAQDDPRTLRLAEKLVAAQTEDERAALLSAEKDLVTVELRKALVAAGRRQRIQGNFPQALSIYRLAQSVAERIDDKSGIADALRNIGTIHSLQGDPAQAFEYLQKSLPLSEAAGDQAGIAATLNNFGLLYYEQGDYGLALEYYRRSLTLYEAIGDQVGNAGRLLNIGLIHKLLGHHSLALDYYQKSLTLFEATGRKIGVAVALTNIGNIYGEQGNYSLALEHYQKSLALREAAGDKGGIASSLRGIGRVYQDQGNENLALEYYQKSLALWETLGQKRPTANTLNLIAKTHFSQGNFPQALSLAERAAALARQINDRANLSRALTTAGNARRALNQFTQARLAFDEAIATIETLRTLVAGGEQEQQRFFEDKVAPYHAMVELLIADNQREEALAYAERAKSRVLLDVLHSGKVNINKAMTAPEQARERQLKSALVSFNTQLTHEQARPQPDSVRLADLQARLHTARLEYEAFETGTYAAHPELKTQRGEARVISLAEAGALLPDTNSALLEYVVTDEQTFLFVLTPTQETRDGRQGRGIESQKRLSTIPNPQPPAPTLKVFTLDIKRKDLIERAESFRRQLAQRDLRFEASARALYAALLEPAHALLRDKRTLVIVPDGVLWELPFQALQSSPKHYLIEDHTLSYAPSLTVLREMSRIRQKGTNGAERAPTLLALGNPALGQQTTERAHRPTLMDENLGALPEAEKQVKALGQLYGAARSRVYVGADAREELMKAEAGNFRILQLATHGILNNASPMYSHVVLAQGAAGAQEDGLLEAWEMMNLDLKADLVVLSACETARGRVGPGEGVIGLTWALFVAGSPAMVVSQWKVESASTTELMLEFHRRLQPTVKRPHTSTAAALQQSSIKLLNSRAYRHPFYWAGFVVVGDSR